MDVLVMKMIINRLHWSVYLTEPEEMDVDGQMFYGLTEFVEQRVSIRRGLSYDQTMQTLLHELMHVFLFSFGCSDKVYDEEEMCNLVGAFGLSIVDYAEMIIKEMNVTEQWKEIT